MEYAICNMPLTTNSNFTVLASNLVPFTQRYSSSYIWTQLNLHCDQLRDDDLRLFPEKTNDWYSIEISRESLMITLTRAGFKLESRDNAILILDRRFRSLPSTKAISFEYRHILVSYFLFIFYSCSSLVANLFLWPEQIYYEIYTSTARLCIGMGLRVGS